MEERTYVKLKENINQDSLQDIIPGELNQPIDVERSNRKCEVCGRPLPRIYIPPADEEWVTGICGCCEDTDSCWTGLICPCILFGRNAAALNKETSQERACISHVICIEGGIAAAALTTAFAVGGVIDPDTCFLLGEGFFFAWLMAAIYAGIGRQSLQTKYHLKDEPCDACMVHLWMHWCAICQEHREMKHHLPESTTSNSTVTEPPQVQEMNVVDKHNDQPSSSSSSQGQDGYNNLQLQPV